MTDDITTVSTTGERAVYLAAVREALAQVLNRDTSELTEEVRLFDDLGLDSSSALEMLIVIEDELDVQFDVEGLDMGDFATVGSLVAYVASEAGS
ncbi:acyl carrier protein [Streptacidiphilus melanogenes]|uniref:acyl carrier protein n=1 Tax=Streptacidiphilus melanogenes TaxID=411235 RepID=UPI0005A6A749|nr:acyl carrier protein [Streptacidiphilus melanogenes]